MKNLVILLVGVMFLYTGCHSPMPGRDLFGEESWDVFARAQRADGYVLREDPEGAIVGGTTFDSSAQRDAQSMHKIWAYLQDHETFGTRPEPAESPVPEFMIRCTREGESVDLVFDADDGWLSLYPTGGAGEARWIDVSPSSAELNDQFEILLGRHQHRDLRPNL